MAPLKYLSISTMEEPEICEYPDSGKFMAEASMDRDKPFEVIAKIGPDGEPVKSTEVAMLIKGIWKGGSLSEYTDSDGHAQFETAADYEDSRELWITARGQRFGPFEIGGGAYTGSSIEAKSRCAEAGRHAAKPSMRPQPAT